MEIIDDFLPEDQFKMLRNYMMGSHFPWNYVPRQAYYEDRPNDFQFFHNFYKRGQAESEYYSLINPTLQKLGGKLVRAKAVLTTQTESPRFSGFHHDYRDMTTAILYINTNNGYTQFRREHSDWETIAYGFPPDPDHDAKVESVANRMVIFDSNLEHAGSTCTDQKIRVLINFNYER